MDNKMKHNVEESRTIAKLRHSLRAKLVSSEPCIADAESFLDGLEP